MTVVTSPYGHDISGPTANRPTNCEPGMNFFDTTTGTFLVWTGTIWEPVGNEQSFVSIAAAGTNQATGGALVEGFNNVTAADGTKGVTLPVAAVGLEVNGYNNSASSLLIYPAVSGTINGGSANASITVQAHTRFSFLGTSTTNFSGSYAVAGTGATLTGIETLTSKTLTAPVINNPVTVYNVASPAAAGTNQGTALAITTPSPALLHVTGANATKGVALPAATAGAVYLLKNDDAANAVLNVYPNGTDTINALSASTAIAMAAKTSCTFYCVSNGAWYTAPLLPS